MLLLNEKSKEEQASVCSYLFVMSYAEERGGDVRKVLEVLVECGKTGPEGTSVSWREAIPEGASHEEG